MGAYDLCCFVYWVHAPNLPEELIIRKPLRYYLWLQLQRIKMIQCYLNLTFGVDFGVQKCLLPILHWLC
ncbi:hypothetical protein ACJX0J_023847, partial [Zea mays]